MTTNNAQTERQFIAAQKAKAAGKGFTPKAKGDPCGNDKADRPSQPSVPHPEPDSSTLPTAKETASTLSHQSHDAMKALQGTGLENAAAYIQRQQSDRNAIVEKVSDAIAYLCDPDVLEADIMSAAAAKVAARSNAWGYTESTVDLDTLFALPTPSPRLIEETP
jgi:hypothetical protein